MRPRRLFFVRVSGATAACAVAVWASTQGGCALVVDLGYDDFRSTTSSGPQGGSGEGGMTSTGSTGGSGGGPDCPTPCNVVETPGEVAIRLAVVDGDDSIYWLVNGAPGRVLKAPKVGGHVTVLDGTGNNPDGIAVDNQFVWYSIYGAGQQDGVRRIPKSGGSFVGFDPCNTDIDVAVDDTYVFYTGFGCSNTDPRLTRVAKGNQGDVASIPTAHTFAAVGDGYIALGATDVYWTDHASVMKAPKATLASKTTTDRPGAPRAIAVDEGPAAAIYLVENTDVVAMGTDFSSPRTIASAQFVTNDTHVGLAVDDDYVYWAADDVNVHGIIRWSLANMHGMPIAANEPMPRAIALDSSHVYWSREDGTIWRMSKPAP
jgi:hypothetical protein